ncbi:hypothetical protein [Agarivorans sp. Alg241-V36]|uniref:hypothetical protein n=1 Tax=Agarivorans sp. Alg241-V36 TaxID=2305992 RepID=UPI0013D46DE9|nr:hypothetical protein [Agarivorans sp. Alg241-V36]
MGVSKSTKIIEYITIFTTICAAMFAFSTYIYNYSFMNELGVDPKGVSVVLYKDDAYELIKSTRAEFKEIKAKIDAMGELPTELPVSTKIAELENRINDLSGTLDKLNNAILESPQKALELPLLKRDIVSLQSQLDSTVTNIDKQVSRAYDMFKWITGSLVLGLISLAIGLFVREKNT